MTLVGHSMGGLIIQSALLELLAPSGSMRTVDHIRQVMLFATPNFGSTTLGKLRSFVSRFVANPQERALRLFSEDGTRIHNAIRDRVITARRRARDQYPIPFYCFWGRTDAIVNPESAVGHSRRGRAAARRSLHRALPGITRRTGLSPFRRGRCTTRTDTRTSGSWSDSRWR